MLTDTRAEKRGEVMRNKNKVPVSPLPWLEGVSHRIPHSNGTSEAALSTCGAGAGLWIQPAAPAAGAARSAPAVPGAAASLAADGRTDTPGTGTGTSCWEQGGAFWPELLRLWPGEQGCLASSQASSSSFISFPIARAHPGQTILCCLICILQRTLLGG